MEKSVTQLIAKMLDCYQKIGGLNNIDGSNLPFKRAIAQLCEDLLRLMFPGFHDEEPIATEHLREIYLRPDFVANRFGRRKRRLQPLPLTFCSLPRPAVKLKGLRVSKLLTKEFLRAPVSTKLLCHRTLSPLNPPLSPLTARSRIRDPDVHAMTWRIEEIRFKGFLPPRAGRNPLG
jgi:hypothetical protein